MKKLIPILLVGMLVLSGLGAAALNSDNIRSASETAVSPGPSRSSSSRDYTHTVLVEVGTATWCPSCPASNAAWHTIYESGTYDFQYTELVYDKNPVASARFYEFNPMWVPTSYWDGGEYVYPGTSIPTFYSYLDDSGSRVVPDLDSNLQATWLGNAAIQISYNVTNNDASDYPGHLHIYVLELESTLWNDYSGNPYHHAFLDFAVNEDINIAAGATISDTVTWDGAAAGYPDITQDNIQVILAVFGDTPHQSYSDPPSGNPFWAYYSDECTAATLGGGTQNNPPEKPTITGPTSGIVGTSYTYTFSTTDPDGDDVFYCLNWSDGTGEICIGPFPSGQEVTASHAWSEPGTYVFKVRAHDINNAESEQGTLEVTITTGISVNIVIDGGVGVSATITNNGTTALTNMSWDIQLNGGIILLGKTKSGIIPSLGVGEHTTVKDFVIGFGKPTIIVNAGDFQATATGTVLLFFVLGVK
jgi:hypothetical protein